MRSLITTLILSMAMVTTSAMAETSTIQSAPVAVELSGGAELGNVFDTTQLENVQALELSSQEMKETQGALFPLGVAMLTGAAFGTSMNIGLTYASTQQFPQWQSLAFSAGTGAVGGGYSNIMLRGAGIATSPFNAAAWQGATGVGNATIRANGALIGQSYVGIHKVNIPPAPVRYTQPVQRPSFNYHYPMAPIVRPYSRY